MRACVRASVFARARAFACVHAPVRGPANHAALVQQHQAVRQHRACWLTPPHPRSGRTHRPVCAHSCHLGSHAGACDSHTRCSTLSTSVTSRCARTTPRAWQMRNVLLNLVQLSMVAVASIPTGLIMKLGRARSAPLVLHGRKLSQVSVSSVAELTAAVGNSAVDKILVAAGTYDFTSEMCYGSAVCIDRALTIEAQVPGSVVLDAKGGRRVFEIQSGGTAELIGLEHYGRICNSGAECLPFEPFAQTFPPSPRWNVTRSTFWLAGRWCLCQFRRSG